jgi:hypothetical protein
MLLLGVRDSSSNAPKAAASSYNKRTYPDMCFIVTGIGLPASFHSQCPMRCNRLTQDLRPFCDQCRMKGILTGSRDALQRVEFAALLKQRCRLWLCAKHQPLGLHLRHEFFLLASFLFLVILRPIFYESSFFLKYNG